MIVCWKRKNCLVQSFSFLLSYTDRNLEDLNNLIYYYFLINKIQLKSCIKYYIYILLN